MSVQHEAIVGRSDVQKVDPSLVRIDPDWNPRRTFGDAEDLALIASVKANGVIQPVRLRKCTDGGLYVIDGERRIRAAVQAIADGSSIESIPAIIERATISDSEAMYCALVSNTGRALAPKEQADAFRRLVAWGQSVPNIARRMGRGEDWVKQRLALVDASPSVMEAVEKGEIPVHAAASIIRKAKGDPKAQAETLKRHREEKARRKEYLEKTPAVIRDIEAVAEVLVGIMEDGGVPEELSESAQEPLRRTANAARWLLDN